RSTGRARFSGRFSSPRPRCRSGTCSGRPRNTNGIDKEARMKRGRLAPLLVLTALVWLAAPRDARAFCGFYVGKADSSLYNQASQVVLVRNGERTVISMMNDYQGELGEFALVVPVPVLLEKSQVHIGDRELFRHIDAYSAPRLVEYYDENPCRPVAYDGMG